MSLFVRRRKESRKFDARLGMALASVLIFFEPWHVSSSAQPPRPLNGDRKTTKSREQLVREVLDPKANEVVRSQAFAQISELDPIERIQANENLLQSGQESYASHAAAALFRDLDRAPEAVSLVVRLMPTWTVATQSGLLAAIYRTLPDPRLFEVARDVLRRGVADQLPGLNPDGKDEGTRLVEQAALVLWKTQEPGDVELLERAVQRFPHARAIWLIFCERGNLKPSERRLGESVYRTGSVPLPVRVAAAAALATEDADALGFVEREVRAYLNRYGRKSIGELFPDLYVESATSTKAAYHGFHENRSVVATLRYLRDDQVAHDLVFGFIDSPNDHLGRILGIVAAIRWSQEYLQAARHSSLEPGTYERLLASVAYFHPELTDAVAAKISKERLERELSALREGGGILSGVVGPMILGR